MPTLILYIIGRSKKSEKAIDCIEQMLHENRNGGSVLTVIDLLQDPGAAEEDNIFATPTLVRRDEPQGRIIGDLRDTASVKKLLRL